jgi:ATP-dependent helicase HrpA
MAALGLGEVEDFGFLDPPDARQIRDGMALLHELGAFHPAAREPRERLTPLGRRLAQLPVDPRLGRMVLEADRLGCADEVIVIAAALSIQDPRVRPTEERAAADEQHARFADERSDFLSYVNLWAHLRERRSDLSGSAFRRLCHAEFLHYMRIREWQDLASQLRQAARSVGVTINQQPADPQLVHIALLSGLLSQLGLRDAGRREYLGARGARFSIAPGSALHRKQPGWVMVAELVETSRLFGRVAAQVQPDWIEPLAGHLLKRTYSEPRWDRKRGSVVATERATLYGLPVVAGRRVAYGPIDPVLSRELFIRHALVAGEWATRHRFVECNQHLLDELAELEHRVRRRDLAPGDEAIFAFYDDRVPAGIVSAAHFDRWFKQERRRDPELLSFTREKLLGQATADLLDPAALPDAWRQGELTLALSYRFEPGSDDDGVTVHVPLRALPGLRSDGFDWLVPGLRTELVTALIRSLPKDLRRPLVPIPDVAVEVVEHLQPRRGTLRAAVARELDHLRGVRVGPDAFDVQKLPAHLRVTFRVEDDAGTIIAAGEDLDALRAQVRPRLRAELAAATASLERTGLRAWTLGDLPRAVTLPGAGSAVSAYPALVDEGDTVGVRALETPGAQEVAMRAGTRRLLALTVPSPLRAVQRGLGSAAALTLAGAPHEGVLDDLLAAAVDALVAEAGGPAWEAAGWAALRDHVAAHLPTRAAAIAAQVVDVLDAARELRIRLDGLGADPALQPARLDVATQLGGLVYPGFVAAAGADRLADIARYLRAAVRRLDRLPDAVAADRDKLGAIRELEAEYRTRPGAPREIAWMLQELRVSQFAQGLGVQGQVSAKRIRRALQAASS